MCVRFLCSPVLVVGISRYFCNSYSINCCYSISVNTANKCCDILFGFTAALRMQPVINGRCKTVLLDVKCGRFKGGHFREEICHF
jgi:hypothetical protein